MVNVPTTLQPRQSAGALFSLPVAAAAFPLSAPVIASINSLYFNSVHTNSSHQFKTSFIALKCQTIPFRPNFSRKRRDVLFPRWNNKAQEVYQILVYFASLGFALAEPLPRTRWRRRRYQSSIGGNQTEITILLPFLNSFLDKL